MKLRESVVIAFLGIFVIIFCGYFLEQCNVGLARQEDKSIGENAPGDTTSKVPLQKTPEETLPDTSKQDKKPEFAEVKTDTVKSEGKIKNPGMGKDLDIVSPPPPENSSDKYLIGTFECSPKPPDGIRMAFRFYELLIENEIASYVEELSCTHDKNTITISYSSAIAFKVENLEETIEKCDIVESVHGKDGEILITLNMAKDFFQADNCLLHASKRGFYIDLFKKQTENNNEDSDSGGLSSDKIEPLTGQDQLQTTPDPNVKRFTNSTLSVVMVKGEPPVSMYKEANFDSKVEHSFTHQSVSYTVKHIPVAPVWKEEKHRGSLHGNYWYFVSYKENKTERFGWIFGIFLREPN